MKVKYLGPSDEVFVLVLGEDTLFKRNHSVEVPDDIAGRAPDPRLAEAMLEHRAAVEAHDHELARTLNDEITGLDYGEGLLAQSDTWAAATPAKKAAPAKAVPKKAAPKKAAPKKAAAKAAPPAAPVPEPKDGEQ